MMRMMSSRALTISFFLASWLMSSMPKAVGQTRESNMPSTLSERVYAPYMQATYLGAGGIKLSDSYLSPLNYGGYTLSLQTEWMRYRYRAQPTDGGLWRKLTDRLLGTYPRQIDQRWLIHRLVSVDYGSTTNPAGNASIMRLQGRWQGNLLYRLAQGHWGQIDLGPGYSLGVGGLYSTRNGNNPATLKADLGLTLGAHYSWRASWRVLPMAVRLSGVLDLVGTQFSQQFGESYYELYLVSEAWRQRLSFTHLGNQLGAQLRLSIDVPVGDLGIVSINYRLQHRAWTVEYLRTHHTDHTISLGLVRYLQARGGRQMLRSNHQIPF